ncbi:MAG: FadR family transcriptional regulator [Alphaproteobacteria bacterium]|nr:FadR family transcriptional regulator [Alphaproteobacteria bacterium]
MIDDPSENKAGDVQSGGSAAMSVADQLTSLILAELAPGSSLPSEANLAARYDVSRLTVREAVKMVAGRGLLELARGRRAVVREPTGAAFGEFLAMIMMRDPKGVFDLIEVRQALEIQSATYAARRANRASLNAIEHALAGMRTAAARMDGAEGRERKEAEQAFHKCDIDFHEAIALASGNRMITYLIEAMAVPLEDSRALTLRGHELRGRPIQATLEAHQAILNFIRDGDSRGAAQAMRSHLEDTERDLRSVLQARVQNGSF